MNYDDIIKQLGLFSDSGALKKMARYGINPKRAYGIAVPKLRILARDIGKSHNLAERLWKSGIHEARILASMVDEPARVTEAQMERWARDFDSWDICDQVCINLFRKTDLAYKKAAEWASREEEFVKRAGFAMMATLAVHDKEADDKKFEKFFPVLKKEVDDSRNFVKKSINWALRQIGKRSLKLNKKAVKVAKEIKESESKSARWVASDTLRELTSDKVRERIKRKNAKRRNKR